MVVPTEMTYAHQMGSKREDPVYNTAKHVVKTGLYIWGWVVIAVVAVMALRQMSGAG
jgi:hypothetical protein